jgi:translation elongation factor EF-Tu-like GTPase
MPQGQAGDNVGLLLRGIKREDVERGQVRAAAVEKTAAVVRVGGNENAALEGCSSREGGGQQRIAAIEGGRQ